jgi:two-component system, OmpR family, response regulator
MTILIVDDDNDQRSLRSMLLAQNGFAPLEAGDKGSARRLAQDHKPEAAVLDLRLPTVEDGRELIRDLKAAHSAMRIVVLTGAERLVVEQMPEMLLIDELMIKPASTAELIRTLRSYE